MPGLSELERRCVAPFYLQMMGLNAMSQDAPVAAVREAGRTTADEQVAELLAGHWRARVMGAWLAAGRTERLATALLASLETSAGSLTAPPLATVALAGLGRKAAPSLQVYLRFDNENRRGSATFVAAVLERLGDPQAGIAVDADDYRAVAAMLSVATRLAGTPPDGT